MRRAAWCGWGKVWETQERLKLNSPFSGNEGPLSGSPGGLMVV